MATTLIMQREGSRLVPSNSWGEELLDELPNDKTLKAVITVPRSIVDNSHYWVWLKLLIDNTAIGEDFKTPAQLHQTLKLECGIVEQVKLLNGLIYAVPDSTAFAKLDQGGMNEYRQNAAAVLATKYNFDPMSVMERSA